jgi:hypothetical protein
MILEIYYKIYSLVNLIEFLPSNIQNRFGFEWDRALLSNPSQIVNPRQTENSTCLSELKFFHLNPHLHFF